MSKYDPLGDFLKDEDSAFVRMGFSEIEKVLGFELPPSSRKQRAWWSNNPTNNVMTRAWIDAGYETGNVDMESEMLTFRKADTAEKTRSDARPKPKSGTHPLFGALRGMLTVSDDLDLTRPADPEWGEKA
ncbi:MAG: hypothetical protein JF571_07655 [Asticcacaulis sp.]|nr:hypothetical protein [Asticcacaulis sp.]